MNLRSPVVFTSINLAYLDRATILAETLRAVHPDWTIAAVLMDEIPRDPSLRRLLDRFDHIIVASDLRAPHFRRWVFGYDVVEACTAIKGPALLHLLEAGAETVIYLDPDIAVFGRLDSVLDEIASASIAVTPHQLVPAEDRRSIEDNEIGSLLTGVFNLGFLAVRNCDEGVAFARWWSSRLLDYCFDDFSRGLFTDQRWMDLAPVFFPGTRILRDPGLNVASWNIADRTISLNHDGEYLVNGRPLRFFHFTKALGIGPTMTMRYGGDNPHVAELWRWYLERLDGVRDTIDTTATDWPWENYANGTPIRREHRRTYRARQDLQHAFPDPFGPELLEWIELTGEGTP